LEEKIEEHDEVLKVEHKQIKDEEHTDLDTSEDEQRLVYK
jgi:hypothetical protein